MGELSADAVPVTVVAGAEAEAGVGLSLTSLKSPNMVGLGTSGGSWMNYEHWKEQRAPVSTRSHMLDPRGHNEAV